MWTLSYSSSSSDASSNTCLSAAPLLGMPTSGIITSVACFSYEKGKYLLTVLYRWFLGRLLLQLTRSFQASRITKPSSTIPNNAISTVSPVWWCLIVLTSLCVSQVSVGQGLDVVSELLGLTISIESVRLSTSDSDVIVCSWSGRPSQR